jgi:signal transduction histidine kinase
MEPKVNKEPIAERASGLEAQSLSSQSDTFQSLSSKVVDFFQEQFFSSREKRTEKEVCEDFSALLLKHWDLCSVITYIRGEDERFHEGAVFFANHLDRSKTRYACSLLAKRVEDAECEEQIWLDAESQKNSSDDLTNAFKDASLHAGIGVPLYVPNGPLVGVLIVVTSFPDRLREALAGIRFIAAPIIIAVGGRYVNRAMSEQQHRIEQLIEELRKRSTDLEEANREMRRVALYRSLFLARLSHELRTPLTSVLGFSEILLDQNDLTPTQRDFCERIQSSGLQLEASLKQLVDLSRIEAGQTELFLQEFSLRDTLSESCAIVGRLANKQEVKVVLSASQNLPSMVSDQGKIRQILYNFLAYAIGRSPSNSNVEVTAEYREPSKFHIKIHDEGSWLEDFTGIFDPIDVSSSKGSGTNLSELGLVIARRLIDVVGGSIELSSAPPKGLTVSLELPARPKES